MQITTDKIKNSTSGMVTPGTLILIILFSLFSGLAVYIYQKQQVEVRDLKTQILEQKNTAPEKAKVEDTTMVDKTVNTDLTILPPATCTICDELPVTVFTPGGLFTDAEKSQLKNKLIDPFFDFQNSTELNYIVMTIEKYNPTPAHGYKYEVQGITKSGAYQSFLFGQATPLEWWLPECMGGCNFTPEFEAKYPEIVEALK